MKEKHSGQTENNTNKSAKKHSTKSGLLESKENSSKKEEIKYHYVKDTVFTLVKGKDTGEKWVIAIGNQIVSKNKYTRKEDAIRYIASKPWELIEMVVISWTKELMRKEKGE